AAGPWDCAVRGILSLMEPALQYILPAASGAVIGYVTNYLAIRMLFRPLKAWRILGVRVPMTPGVIPARRAELARNIGRVVGEKLFTRDDIMGTVSGESFRSRVAQAIESNLYEILDRDLGQAEHILPDPLLQTWQGLLDHLEAATVRSVRAYVETPVFHKALDRLVERQVKRAAFTPLSEFPGLSAAEIEPLLQQRLSAIQRSPELSDWIGKFVDSRIDIFLDKGGALADILPAGFRDAILRQMVAELPALLDRVGGMFHDPAFRARLGSRIRDGLRGLARRLGIIASLFSSVLSDETLDSRIDEFLAEHGPEIASALREPETQAEIIRILEEKLDQVLAQPLSDLLARLPYEKVNAARSYIKEKFLGMLQADEFRQRLIAAVRPLVDRFSSETLARNLAVVCGKDSLEGFMLSAKEKVRGFFVSDEVVVLLETGVRDFFTEGIRNRRIGRLSALVPAEVLHEMVAYMTEQTMELVRKEVPTLIETVDVSRMVEDRVNRLDLLAVEDLIQGIMQEQFKYINLFGALLGALIGFLNALLFWG
ncbi:MAG: DUF445 family protein, partial [Thermodesulfobacteriota bacterium]